MIPGIMPGEHFFVDRRVNQPGSGIKLKRGDIVVFIDPNDRTQYYVKRVIGLPGDKVEISGHVVSVNGKGLTSAAESTNRTNPDKDQFRIYDETSDGGSYDVVLKKEATKNDAVSVQVPNGETFLLGDNRTNSMDSRTFGCVLPNFILIDPSSFRI
jgi:signal peptidase I